MMRARRPWARTRVFCWAQSWRGAAQWTSALGPLLLVIAGRAEAAEYYVAPTGSDANAGTMAQPFATLQKGNDVAAPGDTVWLRGGTYKPTKQVKLSKSGQSDNSRIKYWAYQNELPVLDFSGCASTNPEVDVPAILLTGSWLHLRGFEVKNVPMSGAGSHSNSGVRSEGSSNNSYELLNIHHVGGPGLFISKGTGGNLILNCDSHDNYDKDGSQGDGQNGDGFGVHYQETGPTTIIRGCRAWWNSDDGYDLILQEVPVLIENSWAIANGYADSGTVKPSSGNGNGFKAGSSKTGIRHTIQHCVAWKNTAAGFYANHSSGGNNWYNNTSYNNGAAYNMLASPPDDTTVSITLTGALAHKMRNNIGLPNKNTNMGGVDTKSNSWDLGITPAGSDFVSTSDTGCMGPRQPDGSMPATEFLKLKAGSQLIDKGTDVGLKFVGAAPDLGADEYGAQPGGAGGAPPKSDAGAGSSGSAGSGGATRDGGGGGATSDAGAGGAGAEVTSGAGGTAGSAGVGGSLGNGGSGGDNGTAGGGDVTGGAGGASGSMSGTAGGATGATTGTTGATSGTGPNPAPADGAGCACTVVSRSSGAGDVAPPLAMLGALALLSRRRRGSFAKR